MKSIQKLVEEFHIKYGHEVAEAPTLVPYALADFRYSLMREELEEYIRAVNNNDLVGVYDALCDLHYTVTGSMVVHGLNGELGIREVHRSNMTKDVNPKPQSKPIKGDSYSPPNLQFILNISPKVVVEDSLEDPSFNEQMIRSIRSECNQLLMQKREAENNLEAFKACVRSLVK